MHGKVKLARNLNTGENVAIKIIPRFSKRRRLGKVTARSPEDKTKREIAILKKIRHQNIVALLEIIDDPELKKIYLVLEHVELGEIVWRKKGLPFICDHERRRQEREMMGLTPTYEEEQYEHLVENRQRTKAQKRLRMSQNQPQPDYWSNEYGGAQDEDADWRPGYAHGDEVREWMAVSSSATAEGGSRATSRAPSRGQSVQSVSRAATPGPSVSEPGDVSSLDVALDHEAPAPIRSNPVSSTALDGTMYGAYVDVSRGRSPSMADSIISHMSSVDFNPQVRDPYADDFSYVPCFTFDQARITFRDTVLGLEYLHYQGVVHRDIKPANLLWDKDQRVKISDFGVSYFGRPIRDGEPTETVSESEAQDFDNDLELAKTVGTPAFFAPELCWMDPENGKPQPKISEQIDVWSLGVTLFCLIYARIPFMAEDEFQMFRKIANEEVYIPTRRLAPVDPSTSPSIQSLYNRVPKQSYRADAELVYEDVEPALINLLRRMLEKDPEKRIRLKEIKQNEWVARGIPDLARWLEDTDPARRMSGKRIQVDEREMSHAIAPLNFFEKAKTVVRKTINKVMHPRVDRAESRSRRRATSSVASSGEGPSNSAPIAQPQRDFRRKSARGEDYFSGAAAEVGEHPLSQSVTASPQESPGIDSGAAFQRGASQSARQSMEAWSGACPPTPTLSSPTPIKGIPRTPRHLHTRSVTDAAVSHALAPPPPLVESRTVPPTPAYDGHDGDALSLARQGRESRPAGDEAARSRSVDRALFRSTDKHSEPNAAVARAMAPGKVQSPRHRPLKSIDISRTGPEQHSAALPSPLHFSSAVHGNFNHHGLPHSDSNIHDSHRQTLESDDRPQTAHRVEHIADSRAAVGGSEPYTQSPLGRTHDLALPLHTREQSITKQQPDEQTQQQPAHAQEQAYGPANIPCPPSPVDDTLADPLPPPSRGETLVTAYSTSSVSMAAMTTPLTSPSEVTSPVSTANLAASKRPSENMLVFQSDPSLPALMSGASSVSADPEGEFLGRPGVTGQSPAIDTADSLTPPAMAAKEPVAGFPLDQELESSGAIALNLDAGNVARQTLGLADPASPRPKRLSMPPMKQRHDDDCEDSDSDEGLTMARSKRRSQISSPVATTASPSPSSSLHANRRALSSRRRDTNTSIGSTETAKKIIVHSD